MLWHEGNIADLADSLVRFAPRGSTVTVVAQEEPEVGIATAAAAAATVHLTLDIGTGGARRGHLPSTSWHKHWLGGLGSARV